MLKRVLVVFCLCLPLPTGAAPLIMVFGDSMSSGYGLPQEAGWVSLLKKRLQQERLDYAVVNASISGETTRGGLSRIAHSLA
ncbi:MAG: SGNH/GDSL hydrolase family protein, partial [Burkholderiales bacterium]